MPPQAGGAKNAGGMNAGGKNAGAKNAGAKTPNADRNGPRVCVFFSRDGQAYGLRKGLDGKPVLTPLNKGNATLQEKAVMRVFCQRDNDAPCRIADEVADMLRRLIEAWSDGLRKLQPSALLKLQGWSVGEINRVAEESSRPLTSIVDMRNRTDPNRVMREIVGQPAVIGAQTHCAGPTLASIGQGQAPTMIVVKVPEGSTKTIPRTYIDIGVCTVYFTAEEVVLSPPMLFNSAPQDSTDNEHNSHAVGTVTEGNTLWAIMVGFHSSRSDMSPAAHRRLREAGFKVPTEAIVMALHPYAEVFYPPEKTGVPVVGHQIPMSALKSAPGDPVLGSSKRGKKALEQAVKGSGPARRIVSNLLKVKEELRFKRRDPFVAGQLKELLDVRTGGKANQIVTEIHNYSEKNSRATNLCAFGSLLLWLAWCTSDHLLADLCKLNVKAHQASSNALLAAICQTLQLPPLTAQWVAARTKHCKVTVSYDGKRMHVDEHSNCCRLRVLASVLQQAVFNAGNQGTSDAWALLMNLLVVALNAEFTELGEGAWSRREQILAELREARDPYAPLDLTDGLFFQETDAGRHAKRAYAQCCKLVSDGRVPLIDICKPP